jgi:hypothetical protein
MSLEQLHEDLEEENIRFNVRVDGVTILPGIGEWGSYLALMELPDGWIQAETWISAGGKEISNLEMLCQIVANRFHGRAFINFLDGQFRIYGDIDPSPEAAFYEMTRFLCACDELTPLLEEISKSGTWDINQVNLAFLFIDVALS